MPSTTRRMVAVLGASLGLVLVVAVAFLYSLWQQAAHTQALIAREIAGGRLEQDNRQAESISAASPAARETTGHEHESIERTG
jgi:hypothetical protein